MKINILRQYIYLLALIIKLDIIFLYSYFNTQNSELKNLISSARNNHLTGFQDVGDSNRASDEVISKVIS